MVYDLQNSARTAFYFRWFFRGTNWSGTAPGASHPHLAKNPKKIRSLDRMASQLRDAGLAVRHTLHPDISWLADDVTELLAQNSIRQPYIVLIPGSSARHPHKRWPYYPELARRLAEDGFQIVIAPGPDEKDIAETIACTVLRGPNGFVSWYKLAGLMKGAAFVVGNDTGPSHLAAHLGTPGIALFGPHTTADRTGIERENFSAIEVAHLDALPVERVLDEVRLRVKPIGTGCTTSPR
jgi:ADP-heptose:LPS heptosyltransferase